MYVRLSCKPKHLPTDIVKSILKFKLLNMNYDHMIYCLFYMSAENKTRIDNIHPSCLD